MIHERVPDKAIQRGNSLGNAKKIQKKWLGKSAEV